MAAYMNMIIGLLVVFTFVFILAGIPIYVSLLMTGVLSLLVLSLSTVMPMATIMVKEGYQVTEAVGVIAGASTCGPIIPPSIIMVVYATAVGASVGAMFMGGIIPGILCGVVLMGVVLLRDRTQHFPRQTEKLDKAEKRKIIIDGIIPLGMPIVVVGGIMCGIMTPTEAGAISVVYSLFVSLFIIKTLKIREIGPILLQAVNSTGPLLLIIACARVFSYGLTALKMPVLVNDLILSLTSSKYAFLLLVNVLLLIMGMFMDGGASVIILAPILAPVAASLGISLVHFGIIMAFNLTIGNITPHKNSPDISAANAKNNQAGAKL